MTESEQHDLRQGGLIGAVAGAGALVFVDGFYLNQGVIAGVVGLWVLLVSLPRSALTKDAKQKRRRFHRAAIMLGVVLLVFGLRWANIEIGKKRADELVVAIQAFHNEYQKYPESLEEIVPQFIGSIPRSNYSLDFSDFYYVSTPDSHSLFYVEFPPFGRPTYDFESGKWGYMD